MKKLKFASIVVLLFCVTTSYAQLKVHTTGNISAGGTFSPVGKLHVLGNGVFSTITSFPNTSTYAPMVRGGNGNTTSVTTPDFSWYNDDQTGFFHPAAWQIGITLGGTERVRFNWDGKVGIGTTTPASKLDVEGAVSVGAGYSGLTAAPTNGMIVEGPVGIGNTNPGIYKLYVSGSAYTTGIWATSDSRFKKNIKDIENPLEKIMKIEGKTYDFKTEEFKERNFEVGRSIGFVAQELKEVLPEAVKQGDDGYYSINYDEVIPLLVEGIKEQQGIIEKLKGTIENMKAGIDAMKSDVSECCKNQESNLGQSVNPSLKGTALDQNIPNPFTERTQINFTVGMSAQNVSISVFDMQGTLLKTFDHLNITGGKGSLTINGNELRAGMYLYSLIIDGKEIDTKRMILTK